MGTWNRIQQVCATCRFWQGQRKIDVWCENYTSLEELGQCGNCNGCFRYTPVPQGGYCSDWESYKK